MATKTFTALTAVTTLAAGDELVMWNASAAAARKITVANFIANSPNGGVAEKGAANVFTALQTINSPAAGTRGLLINAAASATAAALRLAYNGATGINFNVFAALRQIEMEAFDNGALYGCSIYLQRNNNASTPGAGYVTLDDKSGTAYYVWPDDSGVMRIHTVSPINSEDGNGTVIGTQTSTLASKNILGDGLSPADALDTILATPVKRFTYKSGAYNNGEFHGIIADYSPEFAMDKGRVFNPVSAFGYMVQSIKALTERIQQLEGVA